MENFLRYEVYSSKQPDIQRYKDFVSTSFGGELDIEFDLKLHKNNDYSYGELALEQNIEDEWLLIYILYELSKFDHDLVIRVQGTYGDVLLIEAAEYLPPWLESSKSKNRVFIHKGKLHIIPEYVDLKSLFNDEEDAMSIQQKAARFVRIMNQTESKGNIKTIASSDIQDAITQQLTGMPNKKIWLAKKFEQLDEIISDGKSDDTQKKLSDRLSLASVMAMKDEYLRISPISSATSSSSSSSSWITETCEDLDL